MNSFAAWLTPRRLRAQALVFALCLWAVCAVDFATPGPVDRAGNIKFQDFLPIYSAARLISQDRAAEIYDQRLMAAEMQSVVGQPLRARLPYLYGPQVALVFVPLSRLPFAPAAGLWMAASLIIYFGCLFLVWKRGAPVLASFARKPALSLSKGGAFGRQSIRLTALAAIAYPPLFHFFVRGQNSALVMACFTAAYLALANRRNWLAGAALGLLLFKPQFLIAIPLILLLSFAWKPLAGLILSASAQIAFASLYFGRAVMSSYFDLLQHPSRWLSAAELSQAAIQMHSLRAFWSLLVPWPQIGFVLYVITSIAVVAVAASVWKSPAPPAFRFSALTLAAVLVNPHLFVYDLLMLAPVLLLLAQWTIANRDHPNANAILVLSYLAFTLPLIGPLSRWTHVQLSVPVFVALLWILRRASHNATAAHELAYRESHVV